MNTVGWSSSLEFELSSIKFLGPASHLDLGDGKEGGRGVVILPYGTCAGKCFSRSCWVWHPG